MNDLREIIEGAATLLLTPYGVTAIAVVGGLFVLVEWCLWRACNG